VPATWLQRGAFLLLLALAVWSFSYRLGAAPLLDDPNEAEYAEVGREMLETGDWISPQLNYVLFLNKPPLSYWMIALSARLFGVNEFASRLPSVLAGLTIVLLVLALGTTLYDAETGLLAGAVLVAMGGFLLEARMVRPDLWLTVGIVGSLLACSWLFRVDGSQKAKIKRQKSKGDRSSDQSSTFAFWLLPFAFSLSLQRQWPFLTLQVALAVGFLAKGFLAVLIPGLTIGVLIALERRFDLLRALLHPRAWWLVVLLVAPWHLAIGLRHPGFLWDYIVNQHVLFFFDKKWPRDSMPVPLATFWSAFAFRAFPWTIVLPLAIITAVRRAVRDPQALGDRLALIWVAVVLVFFSVSPARMEHYSIPALPAVALLVARLFSGYVRTSAPATARLVTGHVVAFAAVTLLGFRLLPAMVAGQDWLQPVDDFRALARMTSVVLAGGACIAALCALRGWRTVVPLTLVATMACIVPLAIRGLVLLAAVDSSAGMAAALRRLAASGEHVVYEAQIEYQNCAGYNFYLRRKLDVLRPADFVPPPYLVPHIGSLFIGRDELARLWKTERVFFITDPLTPRGHLDGSVPEPFEVVARDHTRWVVTNRPVR
jgi:4-amino-4-deoxy-L-arabinose transferase-like glycosyltransferase